MELFVYSIFVFFITLICLNDFIFYRISNIHVLGIMVIYFVGYTLGVLHDPYFWKTFNYACMAFSLFFMLNFLNYMGGGDVKLVFALMFWVGSDIFTYFIIVSFVSLILATCYVLIDDSIFSCRRLLSEKIYSTKFGKFLFTQKPLISHHTKNFMTCEIPYGIPLALGALCMVFLNVGK